MAIIHHWTDRGLHTRYVGTSTAQELLDSTLEISGDERFDRLQYVIGDWSQALESNISYHDIEKLVSLIEALSRSNPRILNPSILPAGESGQALIGLYVMLTANLPWKTTWFDTLAEARVWIQDEMVAA